MTRLITSTTFIVKWPSAAALLKVCSLSPASTCELLKSGHDRKRGRDKRALVNRGLMKARLGLRQYA